MREFFTNIADDVAWVRSTHLPPDAPMFGSFHLRGNEDCPEQVVCYLASDPRWDDWPVAVYVRLSDESPELVRATEDQMNVWAAELGVARPR